MTPTDHERIWLEPAPGDPHTGRQWCRDDVWTAMAADYDGATPTEYIRADLVAAHVAAARREGIEAALAAARKVLCDAEQLDICEAVDAVGDACDAIRALLPGDAALAGIADAR